MSVLTPGKKNLITDVKGLYIGNSENELINTGSTILTCEDRFVASYKVLGGAPGTRETDLLEPDKLVEKIDALFLITDPRYFDWLFQPFRNLLFL